MSELVTVDIWRFGVKVERTKMTREELEMYEKSDDCYIAIVEVQEKRKKKKSNKKHE